MKTQDTTGTSLDDDDLSQAAAVKKPSTHKVQGSAADDALSGDTMFVTVAASDDDLGNHAVFLSINGNTYSIPRGVESEVPVEAVEVLENAQATKYVEINGQFVERQVQRYSFTAKSKPKAKK